MKLSEILNLRTRRFRSIGWTFGLDPYTIDRLIELGLKARLTYLGETVIVQIVDPGAHQDEPREYAAANIRDAEFFVREFDRRSESLHTEGGGHP